MCSIDEVLRRPDREDPAALGEAELGAEIVGLRRLLDAAEARWLRTLAVFDRRGCAAAAGAVTTAAWLRSSCRLSPGAARDRVEVARRLDACRSWAARLPAARCRTSTPS